MGQKPISMKNSKKFVVLNETCYLFYMNAIITNISHRAAARQGRRGSGRTIHLIDIENLCGSSRVTRDQVAQERETYKQAVLIGHSDLVIVASSGGNLLSSYLGWPGPRFLARDGKDGADICLAEVIAEGGLAGRFEIAVVASGDGGLAPSVASLAEQGLHTIVVSRANCISRRMRMAAHESILLGPKLQERA